MKYYGALEAGGTKMVLAILDENGGFAERLTVPTGTPEETMPRMLDFFSGHTLEAMGIAAFGPLVLDKRSPDYGSIGATPKLAWRNYPLAKVFKDRLCVPVVLDTDVNGAALAEYTSGAAKGLESCVYVTVGTGIGGGLVINGAPVHGLMHPELGHILIVPGPEDPMPQGICPSHGHCLEGLASGPSMQRRWGVPARELPPDHPGWALESAYLAQLCTFLMLAVSPQKIILGGGVMQHTELFPLIRQETLRLLNGYITSPVIDDGLKEYIVMPGLGTNSGILGAYQLARHAGDDMFACF